MERKLNVAVIFGGKSEEHEVSLMSAANVIKAMDKDKYNIHTIGITKDGTWMLYKGEADKIQDGSWEKEAERLHREETIELLFHKLFNGAGEQRLDVVFPVLHGPYGEDGTIQGLFEMLDMPYVGCGVLASSVGMDKAVSKLIFERAGLPVAQYSTVLRSELASSMEAVIEKLERQFKYPIFVKPSNLGSSVGITKAHDRAELAAGLREAARHDRKILVEEFINCREFECSIMGNDSPQASCVGEIIPSHEFYDYHAKYFDDGKSILIIPAQLTAEKQQEMQDIALGAYRALDCGGMARADFLMDKDNGRVYLSELNTIPGFTQISMYPKLWEECGLPYGELIDRLIDLAIERHKEKRLAKV